MSIPQLLSGDPSEDLDYSYSKSQNGSGAYDEYSRRSAVAQTTTSDSADDKDSAATVTDVNTDIDVRDSAQSGDTTEEENLLPPARKPSESKTGLPVVNYLVISNLYIEKHEFNIFFYFNRSRNQKQFKILHRHHHERYKSKSHLKVQKLLIHLKLRKPSPLEAVELQVLHR